MTDPDRYRDLFLEEAAEHLAALTDGLLRLENGFDAGVVDELFRAAHSMKGMSATLGYTAEADLAHAIEDHLGHIRGGSDAPRDLVGRLIDAVDVLAAAVDAIAQDGPRPDLDAATQALRGTRPDQPSRSDDADAAATEVPAPIAEATAGLDRPATLVRVHVAKECAVPRARLLVIERTLKQAGTLVRLDPAPESWGGLPRDRPVVLHALLTDVADAEGLTARVGRIPDVTSAEHIEAPPAGRPTPSARPTAAAAPPQAATTHVTRSSTVRVPVKRIDTLLDRAGEVRIALSQLDRLLADHFVGERPYALTEAVIRLEREAKDLHDDALALRTLPVSVITRRFTRLVRDTAAQLGKQVRLVLEGEETEVDRSVLEALGDPVMHLVKNAIGHGIERPDVRRAGGKDPVGTLTIRFMRGPLGVTVMVGDDGGGIDRDRVVRRAIEAGQLDPATDPAALGNDEVFRLLTRPGFSTAESVSDVSGRGVGLDVVQERLNAIGGSIRLESEPGAGTTVRLTLPPTLAIVGALECLVDGDPYYVPVESIVTTLVLPRGARETVMIRDTRAEAARSEDAPEDGAASPEPVHREVRLVDLDAVLGVRARRSPYRPRVVGRVQGSSAAPAEAPGGRGNGAPTRHGVVVERHGHVACLAVDGFGTIQELVVKSVDLPGGGPRYVSGAAIRPDGRVGLLLDVPSLLGAGLAPPRASPASS